MIFDPNAKYEDHESGDRGGEAKPQFLQYKQAWAEERVGDYIGPKVPSLLEFLENRIDQRGQRGKTLVKDRGLGPKPAVHKLPRNLLQEEPAELIRARKDEIHDNVVFKSEWDTLDPTKPIKLE
jgi:hypothetical protein